MTARKLIRLAGFNYGASRNYFFTICVKHHVHSFGTIGNNSMHLSQNGIIALEQWKWLGDKYPYIDLISFVIMPDHIHGIIHIDADFYNHEILGIGGDIDNGYNNDVGNGCNKDVGNGHNKDVGNGHNKDVGNGHNKDVGNGHNNDVGNGRDRSLQSMQTNPKIKPLPELIGAYKTTVSKRIHMAGDVLFKWQKSYHDHIIRDNRSLIRIMDYIKKNPEKCDKNPFHQ